MEDAREDGLLAAITPRYPPSQREEGIETHLPRDLASNVIVETTKRLLPVPVPCPRTRIEHASRACIEQPTRVRNANILFVAL